MFSSSSDVSSSSSSSRDISSLIGRKLESKVKDLRGILDFHGVRISNIDKIQIEHEKRMTKVEKVMDTLDSRTLNMEDGINTLLGRDHISIRKSTGRGRVAKIVITELQDQKNRILNPMSKIYKAIKLKDVIVSENKTIR